MLIRFKVSNYKSINEEVTLNLTPSNVRRHKFHILNKDSDFPVLRGALIYGANASGKSNLCEAINMVATLIQYEDQVPITPFDARKPTKFEYEFFVQGKAYAYGFEYFSGEVTEEWFYLIKNDSDEELIFNYGADTDYKLAVNSQIQSSLDEESNLYLKFLFRSRDKNKLFLPQTVKNDDEDLSVFTDKLKPFFFWFLSQTEIVSPDASYTEFEDDIVNNEKMKEFYSTFLKAFDTGISDIKLSQHVFDDLDESIRVKISQLIEENAHLKGKTSWSAVIATYAGRLNITVNKDGKTQQIDEVVYQNSCTHSGKKFFTYPELSDGTRRLIDIIPALYQTIYQEKVFIIDEIDRSIHPIIIKILLEFFYNEKITPNGQLIVTTHDTGVMEQEFLRKDEIWFVQKEHDGSSLLYALDEYANDLRSDKSLIKDYLNGRYGAVVNYKKAQGIIQELING